jgi:hypothetical protein
MRSMSTPRGLAAEYTGVEQIPFVVLYERLRGRRVAVGSEHD